MLDIAQGVQEEGKVIQARRLWADMGFGWTLTFLLFVYILCQAAGDTAVEPSVSFERTASVGSVLQGTQERIVSGGPVLLVDRNISGPVDAQEAAASDCAAAVLKKSAFLRLQRTAVLPAGFVFAGKFPALCAGGILAAFLIRETSGRARFLRELFIQKKKDGKKRCLPLAEMV